MTGNHLSELLSAYLDGELNDEEHERVLAHLGDCPDCRDELAGLHQARSMVRSLPTLDVPSHALGVDEGAEVIPLRRKPYAWVAAAAVIMVVVIGLATFLAPSVPAVQVPFQDLNEQYRARNTLEQNFSPVNLIAPESVE